MHKRTVKITIIFQFKLPNKKMSLNLKKVKNADLPELSPLSADLCKGVEVYMLEPKRGKLFFL